MAESESVIPSYLQKVVQIPNGCFEQMGNIMGMPTVISHITRCHITYNTTKQQIASHISPYVRNMTVDCVKLPTITNISLTAVFIFHFSVVHPFLL